MYLSFNITTHNTYEKYYEYGKELFNGHKKIFHDNLQIYKDNSSKLDADIIKNNWFPTINADVFLSHSHIDEELAISLAGFLNQELGLSTFIDSCFWGYADELLKIVDNEYCKNEDGETYDYLKRNYSTSNIHSILSMQLLNMINDTECFFFLNTENSLKLSESINMQKYTLSPWIYSELKMASLIGRRPIWWHRRKMGLIRIKAALAIKYYPPLEDLIPISSADIAEWYLMYKKSFHTGKHALDILYKIDIVKDRLIKLSGDIVNITKIGEI